MARDRGLRVEVVVGEEVTTLGGHLLALYVDRPIRPYRSLRTTILAVHDAGGLAIPAHPLVPYPLCAQGWMLRRLLDDPDPAAHPDGLETFNPTSLGKPWHRRVVRFADQHGLARLGNSDAHALEAIATGWTTFPGRTADDLRRAIEIAARPITAGRSTRPSASSARSVSSSASEAVTCATRSPAGSAAMAPAATTATPAAGCGRRATRSVARWRPTSRPRSGRPAGDEDRPRLPVHLPGVGRRRPARPLPLREPAPARPRRPDHHRQPRPAASVRGRHPAHRGRLQHADQRLGRDAHVLAALHQPGPRAAGPRAVRRPPPPRTVRPVPVAVPAARVEERQHRDLPRLCRLLAVVRARQPGHARPRRPAPRPDRGQRRRPPLHRPVLPGRLQGHPQRRRHPALRRGRARWRAGRTARRTCCSSVATSRARACSTCSRRTASCAGPGSSTACSSSAPGRRNAKRGAMSPRAASRRSSSSGA